MSSVVKPLVLTGTALVAAVAAYALYRRRLLAQQGPTLRILAAKEALGKAAAESVAGIISHAIATSGRSRVIVATGASQFEFLDALVKLPVAWDKVTFFHLDEYVGLDETHGASFRRYLRERLFSKLVPPAAAVHYLDPVRAVSSYPALLTEAPIDLACIGIGENGHVAFNDPPPGGANFHDPVLVKRVQLDEACRRQQLGEGWFATLDDVPTHAITLTVPAIMRAKAISCVVPDARKAEAVRKTLTAAVSEAVPATVLRRHPCVTLWLDTAAASLLPSSLR